MLFKGKFALVQSILILVLLTGCTNSEPVQIEETHPRPPDEAMVECETDLPNAKGNTRKDVLEARSATARQMLRCAERHKTLKEYINNILNPSE